MPKDKYYGISRLIARSVIGEATEEETAELRHWRSLSPRNERLYEELLDMNRRTAARDLYFSFDGKTSVGEIIGRNNERIRRKRILRISRYAAVVCVIAAAWVAANYFKADTAGRQTVSNVQLVLPDGTSIDLNSEKGEIGPDDAARIAVNREGVLLYDESRSGAGGHTVYNELIVGRAGEYQVRLPDGTHVWLNSGSRLRYPVAFGGHARKVELEGEAYFDVVRDESAPFVVDAGAYEVTVLGTQFNVSNYKDDPGSRTVLVEGAVAVREPVTGEELLLRPGQSFVMNASDGTFRVEDVDVRRYVAWKDGRFRFYEERLDVIMNVVSRCYDVEVVYDDDELKDVRMTLFTDRYQAVDPLIDVFNEHGKINIRRDGDILYIKKGR